METVRVVCPQCGVELDVKNKLNVEQKVIKCPNCGFQMMVRFRQYPNPANVAQPMQQGMSGQQQYQQQQYRQYQQPQQYQQPYQQQQFQQYQQPQQFQQQPQRQTYRQPADDGHTIYGDAIQQQRQQQLQQQQQRQQQQMQQQQLQQQQQMQRQQQTYPPAATPLMGNFASEATELLNGQIKADPNVAGFLVYNNKKYPLSIGRNTIGRKSSSPKATVLVETPLDDKTMSRFHAIIECVRMGDGSIRPIICNGENKNPTFVAGVLLNASDKLVVKNGAEIKMGNILLRFEMPV